MLIEIYLFLAAIAFFLMILSISSKYIFGKDIIIMPFMSSIIFAILAVSSNTVQIPYCESSAVCFYQTYGDISMMMFLGSMSVFMIVFGFFSALIWTKESVDEFSKGIK